MANALTRLFEKRSVSTLGNPNKTVFDWIGDVFGGKKSINIDEDAILAITPAFRAMSILGDILATMPIGLYENKSNGDVELKSGHRLHKLIANKPGPLYTTYDFFKTMVINALRKGNAIARIYRDGTGVATSFEIIRCQDLRDIFMDEKGTGMRYVLADGRSIHSDDVLHFKTMSTNGLTGLNLTTLNMSTFEAYGSMTEYIRSYFENGGFLSGVIEVPGILADQTYKKAKESFKENFQGQKNAGKVGWLEGGAKFNKIQQGIPESGIESVMKKLMGDIARIYGLPEYMIDATNRPDYSVEQMSIDFKKYTLDGWTAQISQELTRKLIPTSSEGTLFYDYDTTGFVNGDMKTTVEHYATLWQHGFANQNEIRKMMKRNRIEGGDDYYIEGNNMSRQKDIDAITQAKIAKKAGKPGIEPVKQ